MTIEVVSFNITTVPRPTHEHYCFVQEFSGGHITQASFDVLGSPVLFECVLVEARLENKKLVGLSFAARMGDNYTYSVTVVHKDYLRQGIARAVEIKKRDLITTTTLTHLGLPYISQVHRSNESSAKLMKQVCNREGDRWFVNNEHYIFVMEADRWY